MEMLNITRALRNKKKKNDRRSASTVEPMVMQPSSGNVQQAVRTLLLRACGCMLDGGEGVAGNAVMFPGTAKDGDKVVKC